MELEGERAWETSILQYMERKCNNLEGCYVCRFVRLTFLFCLFVCSLVDVNNTFAARLDDYRPCRMYK